MPGSRRRAPLIAEIVIVAAAIVADLVFTPLPDADGNGLIGSVLSAFAPALGVGIGVLAVLRRRFDRVALLILGVASASLLVSGLSLAGTIVGSPQAPWPSFTEAIALALLVGAACHRLPARTVGPLALLAGLAMTLAPLLRYGIDSQWALAAVPAALLWGGSVGTGLVLRDAEQRRAGDLAAVRAAERLVLARELHDFVAHHVTGIVVLAQGARVVASRAPEGQRQDLDVFTEIEKAGGEALTAMRGMVGMLRTDQSGTGDARPDLRRALGEACGDDRQVRLTVADDIDLAPIPPEVVGAAHRLVREALTNARRHGLAGGTIEVSAVLERRGFTAAVLVDVVNRAVPDKVRGDGYGLVGMTERAEAVGGSLAAGPDGPDKWRVAARLPLPEIF
ncbi:histidine kinase [Kribbella antibiotica]|uniref:histidine kinase n=1 Tax=Kribbella antibiotica TaxID=190195 RepID=A0A4R4ZQF3_9ACTN|nr:histidine kinase [Kribbella antibiotica]TDD60274.1 histidine kinase [Kribbella antibiotica]